MKDIMKFSLCSAVNGTIETTIDAEIVNKKLIVSAKEYYPKANEENNYQYTFSFDERNTAKIFDIINLNEFKKMFSGVKGCNNLRSFCIAYDIHFMFDCY